MLCLVVLNLVVVVGVLWWWWVLHWWVFVVFVGEDQVGLWWISWQIGGGFIWRRGLFWHEFLWKRGLGGGLNGLWCGDCCSVWWKSTWSYGGCGKSAWSCVCGSIVGSDDGSISRVFFFFFFGLPVYVGGLVWFDGFYFLFLAWFCF